MTAPLFVPALGCGPCEGSPPPPVALAAPLAHDGWWPGVDLTRLRAEARVRDSVTPERLREAVLGAMIWLSEQLFDWQLRHLAAGRATLGAVPTLIVAGESRLLILYRQAIAAQAKAGLVERYRDMDTTPAGDRRVDELDTSIGELRRDAIHAVRAMLGTSRTDIELI